MAGKIFINYRREDSIATAGRVADRLADTFGPDNLFMDVDNIPVGRDFEDYLNSQVAACDAMLAIIGPNWLTAKDETGQRRLDNPEDFVTIEIGAALARNIPVVPLLVDAARMPKASELPDSLKLLARRQAIQVRNTNFRSDAEALVKRLRETLAPLGEPKRTQHSVPDPFMVHQVAAFLLNIGAFIAVVSSFLVLRNNFVGGLTAGVAAQPFFYVGALTLKQDESVRRFGLVTSVGGMLAVVALIVSGQFFEVALFDTTVQSGSLVMGVMFIQSAQFFFSDKWWKPTYTQTFTLKLLGRLIFPFASMLYVMVTPLIFYRLTDRWEAAVGLVGFQLLVVGFCYARFWKALAANPAPSVA
jgi:hypothetical protein